MILPRRDFLSLLGLAAGAAGVQGCSPNWALPEERIALALRGPGLRSEVQTVCSLCPGGCGMTVRLFDGLPVGLKGNPKHPLNRGGLCPVGYAALDILYSPERLQQPLRRVNGVFEWVGWEDAESEIVARINQLRSDSQGHRLALLNGDSSNLLHELAQRFALAAGSLNAARLRDLSALPYLLTQGVGEVPGFDFSATDMVLSFGLDLFEDGPSPVHAASALIGSRASSERSSILYVGTRLSPTAAKADQYVKVRPGTQAAFALGVAHVLVREGRYDRDFVAEKTFGFEDFHDARGPRLGFRRLLLERYYPDRVAQICGCRVSELVKLARRFSEASAPLALAGGEVIQSANATWNQIAVHSLNALTGAFDRPGGVVRTPSLPLAPLPALQKPLRQQPIFAEDKFPRTDPVASLVDVLETSPDAIDLLLLVHCNPVRESALGREFSQLLDQIPMVVVLTPFLDETAAQADLVLPTSTFLEAWHDATPPPLSAFGSIGLGKPIVEPLYSTRDAGDILLELGHRCLPEGALPWGTYGDYLKSRLERLAVSGEGAVVSGSFEESWKHFLEDRGWRFLAQQRPEDFWNDLQRQAGWSSPVPLPGDLERILRTESGRYEFFSRGLERLLHRLAGSSREQGLGPAIKMLNLQVSEDEVCLPHYEPPAEHGTGSLRLIPFRPVTARGRYSSASPMIMEMFGHVVLSGWQTWAELAPETARQLGVDSGDRVSLENDRGRVEVTVQVRPGTSPGVVHVARGLASKHEEGDGANPLDLIFPDRDPLGGTLDLTSTRVDLRLIHRRPHGEPPPVHTGDQS